MLQSAMTISQSIPDYTAQLNTMSLLRGKCHNRIRFYWKENFSLDLYHVCADPRLAETNDRVIQINDSLQKDYQAAVGLAEHRHLLTVRKQRTFNKCTCNSLGFFFQWTDGACPMIN